VVVVVVRHDKQGVSPCRDYERADPDLLFVAFTATHLDRLSLVPVSPPHMLALD
jgi:hypothetical protein